MDEQHAKIMHEISTELEAIRLKAADEYLRTQGTPEASVSEAVYWMVNMAERLAQYTTTVNGALRLLMNLIKEK